MGSVEQEIKDMSEVPTDLPTVINDFDEVIIRNYFFQNSLYSCMYQCVLYLGKSKFILIISFHLKFEKNKKLP